MMVKQCGAQQGRYDSLITREFKTTGMGSGGKKQSPGVAALLASKYLAHNRVNIFSVKDVIAPYGSSQGL